MAMITAFTVGSGRLGQAPTRKLEQRLSRSRPEAAVLAERLMTKSLVAERAKAEAALAAARRAAAALTRRERAQASRDAKEVELKRQLASRQESAAERAERHVAARRFKAADVAAKAKAVSVERPAKAAAKAAKAAAELKAAEQRAAAFVESRRLKAAAVTGRAALVAERQREKDAEERAELAARMQQKDQLAAAKRLTSYGLTVAQVRAHTMHVLQVSDTRSSYDEAVKQYGKARIEATARRAEALRALHLEEVRAKAAAVCEHARETVQNAKAQLESSLTLTSQLLHEKLHRAAQRVKLMGEGAMRTDEKLSLCGSFIIGADGEWRPVQGAAEAQRHELALQAQETASLEEEWEEVQSPNEWSVVGATA